MWSPVEHALALGARLLRLRGDEEETAAAVRRIRDAGYVDARCDGTLLPGKDIEACATSGDKTGERDYRMCQVLELCWVREMAEFRSFAAEELERRYDENMLRLRHGERWRWCATGQRW